MFCAIVFALYIGFEDRRIGGQEDKKTALTFSQKEILFQSLFSYTYFYERELKP